MTWASVRTPDDRFGELPDYDFESRFATIDGLRIHYLDEGSGRPVILFHGEPTCDVFDVRVQSAVFVYDQDGRELVPLCRSSQ